MLKKISETIKAITEGIKDLTDLLKGDFQDIYDRAMNKIANGKSAKEKSGLENFFDSALRMIPGIGPLIGAQGAMGESGDMLRKSGLGFLLPQSKESKISTNMNNNFNIYGNDAYAIGVSVERNMSDLHTRNLQGMII